MGHTFVLHEAECNAVLRALTASTTAWRVRRPVEPWSHAILIAVSAVCIAIGWASSALGWYEQYRAGAPLPIINIAFLLLPIGLILALAGVLATFRSS